MPLVRYPLVMASSALSPSASVVAAQASADEEDAAPSLLSLALGESAPEADDPLVKALALAVTAAVAAAGKGGPGGKGVWLLSIVLLVVALVLGGASAFTNHRVEALESELEGIRQTELTERATLQANVSELARHAVELTQGMNKNQQQNFDLLVSVAKTVGADVSAAKAPEKIEPSLDLRVLARER